jgi:acyl CoA:acetate/3-ketoacid CoA transferase beta subunit
LIVLMNHLDGDGRPKLVRRCDYPVTGLDCVDAVVTDLAAFERVEGVFWLRAVAEGFTPEDIRTMTELEFQVGTDIEVMQRQLQVAT